MRLYEIEEEQLPSLASLKQLAPEMVKVAQDVYDAWNEDNQELIA